MMLCFQCQMYELPPSRSSPSAIAALTPRRFEYPPWLPPCWIEKPTPAAARPSDTQASPACHQVCAAKVTSAHEPTNHARITAVFNHIVGGVWFASRHEPAK